MQITFEWVPTQEITSSARVAAYNGLWCVPASPYRNMDGALLAIAYARENRIPFLGTCGGFQHAVIDYARNVLGWQDADHAETAPDTQRAVIPPLECALVETTAAVRLLPGTRIAAAYGSTQTTEGYRCRYGLNGEFRVALLTGPLRASAEDERGDVRAVELDGHPFFVATLFQPERAALAEQAAPLVKAFVAAVSQQTRASARHTALLVIDVQQGLCEGEYAVFEASQVIARINTVADKARAAGALVILIQHESGPGDLEYGTPEWQLAQGLNVQPSDLRVRKTTCDSFLHTELGNILQRHAVTDLVICGMQSDFCVDTTTRRALGLGYPVVLVADGHTTEANAHLSAAQIIQHHNDTLTRIGSFGPRVRAISASDLQFGS